jgi:hypothetical protein
MSEVLSAVLEARLYGRQGCPPPRKHLYFRRFFAQFGVRMTRRFSRLLVFALAGLLAAQFSPRAGAADTSLAKSAVLEGTVAYLQVGQVGKNLADEIRAAQGALAVSNKIAGTVLDLRFADGDDLDAAKAAVDWIASKKLPLAILVNGGTSAAAETLASALRSARLGLIFGGKNAPVRPDIVVAAGPEDERILMQNPYTVLVANDTNAPPATNNLLPFLDHTSEADLVRAKVKDGEGFEPVPAERAAEPQKPFLRDPVLARAVDLIKGLAIVGHSP